MLQVFAYTSIFQQPGTDEDMSLVYHSAQFKWEEAEAADQVVPLSLPASVHKNNKTLHLHMFLMTGDKKINVRIHRWEPAWKFVLMLIQ